MAAFVSVRAALPPSTVFAFPASSLSLLSSQCLEDGSPSTSASIGRQLTPQVIMLAGDLINSSSGLQTNLALRAQASPESWHTLP